MLVAMTDLLESGRVDEQLAMLDEFERARGHPAHAAVRRVRELPALVPPARRSGEYAAGRTAGRTRRWPPACRRTGTNTEMAHAGQMFCLAWDRGQLGDVVDFVEMTAASQPAARDLARRPRRRTRRGRPARRGPARRSTSSSRPTGSTLPDDSLYFTGACFLVEAARAARRPHACAACCARTLEPYAGRVAITGLGGVGDRAGAPLRRRRRPRRRRCSTRRSSTSSRRSPSRRATALRPFTARAHRDLAAALTDAWPARRRRGGRRARRRGRRRSPPRSGSCSGRSDGSVP